MLNESVRNNSNIFPQRPPNRLPIAITATVVGVGSICMCFIGVILGAIGIIFATQADTKYNIEDYTGAQSSSQVAFVLSIVSLSISVFSILIFLFIWAIAGIGDGSDISSQIDSTILRRLF